MKKLKNKIAAITIAILMTISMAASMMLVPTASAHTPPWTIPTYAFITLAPNPAGVSQSVYVSFWIDKAPPSAYSDWGYRWHNMTVAVTTPGGTTTTLGPFSSDATGGVIGCTYVPTEVGEYTFVGHFPQQTPTNENPYPYPLISPSGLNYINDTFEASTSNLVTLTVQQAQITTAYPPSPLPTGYWTRPINSMNRDWYSIGGNWLGLAKTSHGSSGVYDQTGNFDPYTTAPTTAHIMWTKPLAFGGQIGGEFGSDSSSVFASGTMHQPQLNPVIICGILYYTEYPGAGNNFGPLTAVDLRTGQTLWTVNANTTLRCGMIYNFITGDQYGAHSYLFTGGSEGLVANPIAPTTWSMYDAMTGQWILNIANVSEGTLVEGSNGELLSYKVSGGQLSLWNASKCIAVASQAINKYSVYSAAEIWRPPQGSTIDWNGGYEWRVPIVTNISGVPIQSEDILSTLWISDGVILTAAMGGGGAFSVGPPGGSQVGYRIDAGYSETNGHLLWGPVNRTLTPFTNVVLGPVGEGVYTEYAQQSMTWSGYSLKTGEKLWGPIKGCNSSLGYYNGDQAGATYKGVIGYGNFYSFPGFSGEVYCYDVQTGALIWSWNAGSSGVDTPYGTEPLGGSYGTSYILADGKLYIRSGHDFTAPVYKGAKLYCLNATTGQLIWSTLNFNVVNGPAVADGIMVWDNAYDNQIYAYGMGPSKTTVEAPNPVTSVGSPIVIQGTVTDISAGSQQNAVAANFPNGLPAVSDASQTQFMEAVYEQQPMPTNTTGVPVTLSVLDSNGNYRQIGNTTSNADGMFSYTWTPDIPGDFTVIANFAGSESYYPSHADTSFYASAAPPTASPYPVVNLPPTETYFAISTVAIIIAIAIVGALIMLMLRKRP